MFHVQKSSWLELKMLKGKISSFCGEAGNCVEVVSIGNSMILVRNTTNKNKYILFSHNEWEAFILGVKNNEFDL